MKIFKKLFYLAKFHMMYYYKIRYTNKKIDNYAGELVFNPVDTPIELPKKIWIYWEGYFPEFVEKCIDNIHQKNPTYEVHVLNPENVNQYTQINFSLLETATPQQKADLLRFDLLYHYGGIWLDASIILYESLDWIAELMQKNQTESFSYYRKKNTTNLNYPVLENWLLASVKNNIFFKYWYDELYLAIQKTPKKYVQEIKDTEKNTKDIFQRISNLEYLVAYVACQKVLRRSFPSLTLIDCDENAFYCQVKNRWIKEKILIDMTLNYPAKEYPKLIKLAGKERNYLCQYYDKGMYFKGSLIDF
ncbi:glycosyltransferase family 32 protein [Acinetobacter nematophilus]|uniref:Glycosyltransferase n=1 Tax=Acinetobacter nematophilus TaxID=2994642 RepID=A0A9X3DRR8_9GAMM|nr:capsular polysaccharide synthesis protein [Acinetobacter nematophilus]MCX5466771.1 glycosyltransferase [Acinetobacter nematophilus]